MRDSATKLRIMSPEPISSTNDSATSAATTPPRNSFAPPRPGVRPAARNTSPRSGRDARNAGTTPNSSADTTAHTIVNARTNGSSDTVSSRGKFVGASATRSRMPSCARAKPSTAPPVASKRLSANICLTSRQGEPPNAARTASSRSRTEVRTSSRLATFAHAISSTKTTAPINARIAGRTSATMSSCIPTAAMCSPAV